MLYYLSVQVDVYEMSHGKLPIPSGAMPPAPMPPTGEHAKYEIATPMYEYIKKMWEQFTAAQSG
jgi:hypothetical protein